MTRRAYLYFVITFLIGLVIGGAAVYTYAWNFGHWRRPWNEEAALKVLQKRLDLSDAQTQQIKAIWDDTHTQVRKIQAQVRPQIEACHHQTDQRIRKILNSEQVKKFDELLARRSRPKPPGAR